MSLKVTSQAFQWDDPLSLEGQITADERAVRDSAHAYCQEQLLPKVQEAFRHEQTDIGVFRGMGELGLLGATIPEAYGGAGLNYVCYGLIAREVERVDSGYRSMMSVQSSLVMVPIHEFGNKATKQKYLPKLATGEWVGRSGEHVRGYARQSRIDSRSRDHGYCCIQLTRGARSIRYQWLFSRTVCPTPDARELREPGRAGSARRLEGQDVLARTMRAAL